MKPEERANAVLKGIANHCSYIAIADKDNVDYLLRHFKDLIKEEREACAKIADNESKSELKCGLQYEKDYGLNDTRVSECLGGHKAAKDN